MFRLEGKRALVTGASRGLGRAIAVGLAERGPRVAVAELPDRVADAQEVARQLGGIALALDVRDVGRIRQAAYCSAKAGLVDLIRLLALEWAAHRILVNAVVPTFHRDGAHRGHALRSGAQARHPFAHTARASRRAGRRRRGRGPR